jgi:transmembrane sensor
MAEETEIEEAARWFLRLQDDDADANTFLEWQRWLHATPGNRSAYRQIESTVLRTGPGSAAPTLPTQAEMDADPYDGSLTIKEWRDLPFIETSISANVRRPYALAGLASIAFLAASLLAGDGLDRARHGAFLFATSPGKRGTYNLPDGSVITLDAGSKLEVVLTQNERSLRLIRGEAYFRVARDRSRPFIVHVVHMQARAVGTVFDVHVNDQNTVVAVLEGKVEVSTGAPVPPERIGGHSVSAPSTPSGSAASLGAQPGGATDTVPFAAQVGPGEAIEYTPEGTLAVLPRSAAALTTVWLEGRRVYSSEPLRDVLADVRRYSGRQIEVADAAAGKLRFTGSIRLDNTDAWLKALPVALPVSLFEREDGCLVVRSREAGPNPDSVPNAHKQPRQT